MNYNIYRGSYVSLSWFSWGSTILVEFEFGVLVFEEGGKEESPKINPWCKARTDTNLTHI